MKHLQTNKCTYIKKQDIDQPIIEPRPTGSRFYPLTFWAKRQHLALSLENSKC